MGIFCIILGILFLLLFTGGGYVGVNALSKMQLMGQSIFSFIGFKSNTTAYIVIVGACFIIGLLLCITFVMIGANSKRISSLNRRLEDAEDMIYTLKKKNKKSKKAVESSAEESAEDWD